MTKKIIFEGSFFVSTIMCHQGCGIAIENSLHGCLQNLIEKNRLPADAQLVISAEPKSLGIQCLLLTIESENLEFQPVEGFNDSIHAAFKLGLEDMGHELIANNDSPIPASTSANWVNILVNLLAAGAITVLWLIFPPSLLLTIVLTTLSLLATTFTARNYLSNFLHNLRNKNLANMTTTVTFGWFLSLIHTLYHSISMPMASSFSMAFMSFIMPVVLITIINGMDELKRLILLKSQKMQLQGVQTLFPQMAEKYRYYQPTAQEQIVFNQLIGDPSAADQIAQSMEEILLKNELITENRNLLKEKMIIEIKRGECFPVDCILVKGNTVVDASLLTGERCKNKKPLDAVPAGAINLGQTVFAYATKNGYHSTVNRLLFSTNRGAKEHSGPEAKSRFAYLYPILIGAGIIASIVIPFALGIVTIPLILQNVMGIVLAICPCTIAIAHQLPNLLSLYHCGNKGIQLRDERLTRRLDKIHTVVFDKTGTLTTGHSKVESYSGEIYPALWEKIYLLEKHYGAEHPLAKAIVNHYESSLHSNSLFHHVLPENMSIQNGGLTGKVQGKLIQLGHADYLRHAGIIDLPAINPAKMEQGLTPIFVAEDKIFKGIIYIKHEIRPGIQEALARLKGEGKKIIMLTGDNKDAAAGFNKQIGSIFDLDDIHADQSPEGKETFLGQLMESENTDPRGVWFVGDGLNDGPCIRAVSDKGGISCAMTAHDKASFFADIVLNGSLDYLFNYRKLNRFLHKNVQQNQWILALSSVAFLLFIISFSAVGIAVSPLIPLTIMVLTTLFALFNSYRIQLAVDIALDKSASWIKQLLASDLSIGLLTSASCLLIFAVIISTITCGGLTLPALVFTGGIIAAISSGCELAASLLFAFFALLTVSYVLMSNSGNNLGEDDADLVDDSPGIITSSSPKALREDAGNLDFPIGQLSRGSRGTYENDGNSVIASVSEATQECWAQISSTGSF